MPIEAIEYLLNRLKSSRRAARIRVSRRVLRTPVAQNRAGPLIPLSGDVI
jgi:hypothetical protein